MPLFQALQLRGLGTEVVFLVVRTESVTVCNNSLNQDTKKKNKTMKVGCILERQHRELTLCTKPYFHTPCLLSLLLVSKLSSCLSSTACVPYFKAS